MSIFSSTEILPDEEELPVQQDDEFLQMVSWLKYNCSPTCSSQVKDYMQRTAVRRHMEVVKSAMKVKDILGSYPRLLDGGMVSSNFIQVQVLVWSPLAPADWRRVVSNCIHTILG
jgi:hypothetical protein